MFSRFNIFVATKCVCGAATLVCVDKVMEGRRKGGTEEEGERGRQGVIGQVKEGREGRGG